MNEIHINTVSGNSTIGITTEEAFAPFRYKATFTQSGAAAPVFSVIDNTYPNVFTSNYAGSGSYYLSTANTISAGSYVNGNAASNGTGGRFNVYRESDTQVYMDVINQAGSYVNDDIYKEGSIVIETSIARLTTTTNSEDVFQTILLNLSTTQLAIWSKIIVRHNGTAVEVDGDKWRKTGVYATSSKAVNS